MDRIKKTLSILLKLCILKIGLIFFLCALAVRLDVKFI